MPVISDYGSLSQAIADYTHRSDLYSPAAGNNTSDYFLQSAQEMINKDIFDKNFGNGIELMEAYYGPQVITNGITPVPTDYLAPKYFNIADNGGNVFTLILKDPQWIYDTYPVRQPTRCPAYIARDVQPNGSNGFIFGPYPDSAYTVGGTYYQKAALLNATQTTNWMVISAPTVFFAAAMIEAMLYTRDSEGTQIWQGIYQARLQQLIDQDKAERWGSATMQIELG